MSSSEPSSSHIRNVALPGFHDLSAFANPNPYHHHHQQQPQRHDSAVAGPSRQPYHPTPPAIRFDNQHFMSEVNAANASTNGTAPHTDQHPPMTSDPAFDILDWYPAYQSCQRYFLDVAQHEPGTQALCALINIRLPFQYLAHPITSSSPPSADTNNTTNRSSPVNWPNNPSNTASRSPHSAHISLVPYIRRLVITGFDKPAILHGFFGDDYARGVLPHLDCERRNYLFAAKHGGWRTCKKQYDAGSGVGGGDGDETVPFMKPLDGAREEELVAAEKAWGKWLAMEDWMVGPNAPAEGYGNGSARARGDVEGLPDGVQEAFEQGR